MLAQPLDQDEVGGGERLSHTRDHCPIIDRVAQPIGARRAARAGDRELEIELDHLRQTALPFVESDLRLDPEVVNGDDIHVCVRTREGLPTRMTTNVIVRYRPCSSLRSSSLRPI